jgi:hypothetical protein
VLFVWLGLLRPAFGTSQLIVNGGFENTSADPWVLAGSGEQIKTGPPASGLLPYDGAQYLSMGNAFGGTQVAYQTVTFPTNLIAATLNFAYDIVSGFPASDQITVYITTPGASGTPLLPALDSGSSQQPTGGWGYITNNFITYAGGNAISSYAGMSVNVEFYVTTDPIEGGYNSFNIDDVSLTVATTADIPSNDNFSNAAPVATAGVTNIDTTTYASKEAGEPNIGNNAGGHSVWWTWTAPALGTVTISTTGSTFTTLLGLYTGTSVTNLTAVTNSDGISRTGGFALLSVPVSPGTQYFIGLDGYNGQSGNAIFTLKFTQDTTAPTVSIKSPVSGSTVTNSSVLVKGTATDNVGVAAVYYQLANAAGTNDWQLATGTTAWSATVTNLIPGKNTVNAKAYDTSTNVSKVASGVYNYVVPVPLNLTIVGGGSVSGGANGKPLNLGYPYTLTAAAKPGFRFGGWTGDITTNTAAVHFTMTSNFSVTATFVDSQKPALTITAPKAAQRWSNSVFTVTGTAKDNVGVASVWVQVNGGAWSSSVNSNNGFTNWNGGVTLNPGANVVKAYAVDAAGNFSPTNSVSFTYVLSAPVLVQFNGSGSAKPNYNNVLLQISNTYSMTATAGSGYLFSNWTTSFGGVITNGPTVKFVMESNLDFVANFVPNPFLTTAGTYQGLFYDADGVTMAGSGFFSAQVMNTGSFTASFKQGNTSHPISGKFSLTGDWATNELKTWGNTAISLHLDLLGGKVISGGLTNAAWVAGLEADQAVYSKNNPTPQTGKYTLVLPGADSASLPGGNGFGTLTVANIGGVIFSGTLGDGTKVTQTANESEQGLWPVYVSLYGGNGMLLGWLTFTNEPDRDIDGVLNWFKPAQATSATYKAGFTNQIEAAGSAYSVTSGEPILNLSNGDMFLDGGGLTQNITNHFTLSSKNVVTGAGKLHLTFTTSTGLFTGTTTNAQGKTVSFGGAVLQKQTNGFGQFINGAQTGSVNIAPQ